MNNRWYDNHTETTETFKLLKNLDYDSLQTLADDIIEISNQIKEMHSDEEEPVLSIGLNRVLGLYQSSNSRRWYDKKGDLTCAIRTISTLPEEDFKNIMEGLYISLNN